MSILVKKFHPLRGTLKKGLKGQSSKGRTTQSGQERQSTQPHHQDARRLGDTGETKTEAAALACRAVVAAEGGPQAADDVAAAERPAPEPPRRTDDGLVPFPDIAALVEGPVIARACAPRAAHRRHVAIQRVPVRAGR